MVQEIEMTVDEQMTMYMKCSKKELCKILIEANKHLKNLPIHVVSNRFDSKYTPPFRVGRKQGKAVLDANGIDVVFFSNSEEQARRYCDYLNGC